MFYTVQDTVLYSLSHDSHSKDNAVVTDEKKHVRTKTYKAVTFDICTIESGRDPTNYYYSWNTLRP